MKIQYSFLRKLAAFLILVQALQQPLLAQDAIGYNYNSYIGVNGIVGNPASIAASRYKVHVNLISGNLYAGSNAYEFNRKKIFDFNFNLQDSVDYRKINSSEKKNAWTNIDILGPSVLVNLNSKSAIGVTTRFRTLVNAYNLSSGSFNLVGKSLSSVYGIDFNEKNVRISTSSFADLGLTYARVIENEGKNFVKGGITVKYIQGIAAGYMKIDTLNVNIQDANSLQTLNGNGSLVYSDNIDRLTSDSASFDPRKEFSMRNGTFGMDLGIVYEHRSGKFPPVAGSPKSFYRTIPYDFRLSVALTDFAFAPLKFKQGSQSAKYTLTANNVAKDTFNVQDSQTMDDYIQNLQIDNLLNKQSSDGDFTMPLPTSLRANIDWHIAKSFFVNADALISIRGKKSKKSGNYYVSTFSVTPRFETQWISVYSPVSLNMENEFNWGAGFRLGPLFAGSGSVLSNLLKKDLKNIDAHFGLSIPLYQGPKRGKKKKVEEPKKEVAPKSNDRDKDGVIDDKDACPDVPGPVADNGCPDTDKDGVADDKDKCPTITGLAKYNGCPVPDSDNDGVTDEKDKCLTIAGPVTNYGCPEIKLELKKTVAKAAKNLFFNSGKATLQARSYPALNKLAAILKTDNTLFLDIEGHTDNIGNDARNMKLSRARANAAKQYLVDVGISEERITTYGYGETRPIAPNTTVAGRSNNRRIVLKLRNY